MATREMFNVIEAAIREVMKIITEKITASQIDNFINSEIATAMPDLGFPIRTIAKIEYIISAVFIPPREIRKDFML